jgi:hypothetical protein
MATQLLDKPRGQDAGLLGGGPEEHNFAPDFAWAVVGGIAFVAACAVVYTLAVSWGGLLVGAPMPGGGSPPLSTFASEFTGIFLAGFLIVLIARSLSVRTR